VPRRRGSVRASSQRKRHDVAVSSDARIEQALRPPARGLAHARKGGIVQTLKRTIAEFKADNLTELAAAITY
jgi:hypothetical protein